MVVADKAEHSTHVRKAKAASRPCRGISGSTAPREVLIEKVSRLFPPDAVEAYVLGALQRPEKTRIEGSYLNQADPKSFRNDLAAVAVKKAIVYRFQEATVLDSRGAGTALVTMEIVLVDASRTAGNWQRGGILSPCGEASSIM